MNALLKRIVFISPYAGSIVSFRGPLIKELIDLKAEVYVLAPDYSPEIRKAVEELGAKPVDYLLDRTGTNFLNDLKTLFQLSHIFIKLKPQVIVPYNIKPIVYGLLAGAFTRVPTRVALIEGLGYAFIKNPSLKSHIINWIVRFSYKVSLAFAHYVFFLNPDDLNDFLRLHIVNPEKVRLLGGIGFLLDEWQPAPPVTQPVTFTLAARLLKEKGICEYAEAAKIIKRRYPRTRFILLGGLDTNPGALKREEVEKWVRDDILEWYGNVPDVRPYFAQTSVYVLPSYYREGVPRSTQEAMAMGRPVITTDAPGCRETVIDGVNGFLIPPRDPEALIKAMERFILRPELIIQMGNESRKLVEERFDARKQNQKFLREIMMLYENQ